MIVKLPKIFTWETNISEINSFHIRMRILTLKPRISKHSATSHLAVMWLSFLMGCKFLIGLCLQAVGKHDDMPVCIVPQETD